MKYFLWQTKATVNTFFLMNKSCCNYLVCRQQCNFKWGSQTTKYFLRQTKGIVNALVLTNKSCRKYLVCRQKKLLWWTIVIVNLVFQWLKAIVKYLVCHQHTLSMWPFTFLMNFDCYWNIFTTSLIHYLQQNNSVDNKREIISNILIARKHKYPKSFSLQITSTNP